MDLHAPLLYLTWCELPFWFLVPEVALTGGWPGKAQCEL